MFRETYVYNLGQAGIYMYKHTHLNTHASRHQQSLLWPIMPLSHFWLFTLQFFYQYNYLFGNILHQTSLQFLQHWQGIQSMLRCLVNAWDASQYPQGHDGWDHDFCKLKLDVWWEHTWLGITAEKHNLPNSFVRLSSTKWEINNICFYFLHR